MAYWTHTEKFVSFVRAPPGGVRFTNSRTIFWIFTNSRTREKWQVSRFQERDFVNSRTTINKYAGIHEFTNNISSFQKSRTKWFSRIHERFFSFSRIHERKKTDSRCTNRAWGPHESFLSESFADKSPLIKVD